MLEDRPTSSEDDMKGRVGLDDQVLVERLRARDRRAQSELFSRLRRALWRPASRIVGNVALADDVIQDAWIHAIVGIDSFRGRARFGTWLASIVLNKARCHRRRESRCRPFSAVGPTELEPAHGRSEETPEQTFRVKEAARRAEQALDSLSRRQRSVIVLRDFQGASPAEACDTLQMTDLAHRIHLCRARATVRRALESEERLCA
jgi:RNA polymerase sigma-70 factor, ECF subfamily